MGGLLMPIGDYLSDRETQRQQSYNDLSRRLGQDVIGKSQREIMALQARYLTDRSNVDAEMDRTYDPHWWQVQQFTKAAGAYAPSNYEQPQGLVDNYAPLRAETEANNQRRADARASELSGALSRQRDYEQGLSARGPKFDANGELIDRTGVVDMTPKAAFPVSMQANPMSPAPAPCATVAVQSVRRSRRPNRKPLPSMTRWRPHPIPLPPPAAGG
jgi:hypothetical protein